MQDEPQTDVSAWMVEEIMRVPSAVASTILVNQTLREYTVVGEFAASIS
jgi:hypothetical protein